MKRGRNGAGRRPFSGGAFKTGRYKGSWRAATDSDDHYAYAMAL